MWCYRDRVEWNGLVFDLSGPEIAIDAPEGEEKDRPSPEEKKKDRKAREKREKRDRERVAMEVRGVRGALAGVRPDIAVVSASLSAASLSRWQEAVAWAMRRKVSSRLRKEPERLYDVLRLQGPLPGRPEGFPGGDNSKWAAEVDD